MSSLLVLNRQADGLLGEQLFGGGLPFYRFLVHQDRFQNNKDVTDVGIWQVPITKLPTFQLALIVPMQEISLVNVISGNIISVPIGYLYNRLIAIGSGSFYAYAMPDNPFPVVDCGLYYYYIKDNDDREFFSEVFSIKNFGDGFPVFESHINIDEATACGGDINLKATIQGGTITNVSHSSTTNTIDTSIFDDICITITGTTPETVRFYFDVLGSNGALVTYTYELVIKTPANTSTYIYKLL